MAHELDLEELAHDLTWWRMLTAAAEKLYEHEQLSSAPWAEAPVDIRSDCMRDVFPIVSAVVMQQEIARRTMQPSGDA